VRHLVKLHGGAVRAQNVDGGGALFTVTLPRLSLAQPVALTSADSAADGASRLRLDGIRVVLVEDETDAREALTAALQGFGADVVAVESAAAALDALRLQPPDVLLSDLGMPDEDGYSLIRKVRADEAPNNRLPAAALTAYVRAEDRSAAVRG